MPISASATICALYSVYNHHYDHTIMNYRVNGHAIVKVSDGEEEKTGSKFIFV